MPLDGDGNWYDDEEEDTGTTPIEENPDGNPEVTLPDLGDQGDEAAEKTKEIYDRAGEGVLDRAKDAYDVEYRSVDPEDTAQFKPQDGTDYVTPESTVAGQLTKLLDKDSDYIKQARARADAKSQASGLLSSSMAAGAAEGAAIERALPIAQQDAQTYGKLQEAQQNADYNQAQAAIEGLVSGQLQENKYELLDRSQALQASFDAAMKGADAESAIALQELKGQWDFALADSVKRLEYYLQKDLNEQNVKDVTASEVRLASADLIKNNQIAIENLLKDPDMLELGAEAYGAIINNMIAMTTSGIQLIYDASGLDMDGFIEDILADYEASIQWDTGDDA